MDIKDELDRINLLCYEIQPPPNEKVKALIQHCYQVYQSFETFTTNRGLHVDSDTFRTWKIHLKDAQSREEDLLQLVEDINLKLEVKNMENLQLSHDLALLKQENIKSLSNQSTLEKNNNELLQERKKLTIELETIKSKKKKSIPSIKVNEVHTKSIQTDVDHTNHIIQQLQLEKLKIENDFNNEKDKTNSQEQNILKQMELILDLKKQLKKFQQTNYPEECIDKAILIQEMTEIYQIIEGIHSSETAFEHVLTSEHGILSAMVALKQRIRQLYQFQHPNHLPQTTPRQRNELAKIEKTCTPNSFGPNDKKAIPHKNLLLKPHIPNKNFVSVLYNRSQNKRQSIQSVPCLSLEGYDAFLRNNKLT